MTKEEKAKAYDEALERARIWKDKSGMPKDKQGILDDIFPELKESEDERIRKAIIESLPKYGYLPQTSIKVEDAIAWLEKQAEQKPIEIKTAEESLGIDSDTYNKIIDECIFGEQKSTDKVEPKFHEGDWVVWKDKCYKVNYNGCGYELVDQDGLSTSLEYATIDENAHIWDVTTDVKDGDVLYCKSDCGIEYIVMNKGINCYNNIDSYFRYNSMDGFDIYIPSVLSVKGDNITPATKEQRDLLFQKMHEAGYEWDAEKKEVKKIEQKPTDEEIKTLLRTEYEKGRADAIAEMNNLAWSEEDEEFLRRAINATKDAYPMTAKWLKSLKPQNRWKPSDEQLEALKNAIHLKPFENPSDSILWGLYEQLKKL